MRYMLFLMVLFSFNSFAMDAKATEEEIRNSRPKGTSVVEVVFGFYDQSKVGLVLSRDKSGFKENLSIAGSGQGSLFVADSSVKEFQGAQRDFKSNSMTANIVFNAKQYEQIGEVFKKCQQQSEAAIVNNGLLVIRGTVYWSDDSLKKVLSSKAPNFNVNLAADYKIDCYVKWLKK